MRFDFPRRILLFVLIALILIPLLGVACAFEGGTNSNVAYPVPGIDPTIQTHSGAAHWLIVGAVVIVVIIFGGVALRRNKS